MADLTAPRAGRDGYERGDGDLAAFVAVPVVALLLWIGLTFLRLAWIDGWTAAVADLPGLLLGGATFGLAVAVAATLLLAGPAYAVLSAMGDIRPASVLAVGAGVGLAVAWLLPPGTETLAPGWLLAFVGAGTALAWLGLRARRGSSAG